MTLETCCGYTFTSTEKKPMISDIALSWHILKFYDDKFLINILLHEMIHVEASIKDPTWSSHETRALGGHNKYFIDRMNELNHKHGEINITLRAGEMLGPKIDHKNFIYACTADHTNDLPHEGFAYFLSPPIFKRLRWVTKHNATCPGRYYKVIQPFVNPKKRKIDDLKMGKEEEKKGGPPPKKMRE